MAQAFCPSPVLHGSTELEAVTTGFSASKDCIIRDAYQAGRTFIAYHGRRGC